MIDLAGRMALLLVCSMSSVACVTIKRDVEATCEVVPVVADWNPVVAPFYFPKRVQEFQDALAAASDSIEIIDTAVLWRIAFPDRDPDADARVREFQDAEVSARVAQIGLEHLVVLTMTDRTVRDQTVRLTLYNTQRQATTRDAVLLSFTEPDCRLDRYEAQATGRDHLAWFYVAVLLDADTEAGALHAVAERMGQLINSTDGGEPIKVAVVAAKWSG
jgi:hypothetical protein